MSRRLKATVIGAVVVGIAALILFFDRSRVVEISNAPLSSTLKLWPYQCIDTMKISRDMARAPLSSAQWLSLIDSQLRLVSFLGANCVAVGTPYDEEFIPLLRLWIQGARKEHLHVWFRGNLSGWEGWFNYPLYKNPQQYYHDLDHFIGAHPDLFEAGDILTPSPEPEHGIIKNIWLSPSKRQAFQTFVINAYQHCQAAMTRLTQGVTCGYISFNVDVARKVINKDIVQKTGNVIAIDHYVKTAQQFGEDIAALHETYQVPVVVSEFGVPIPDIHGKVSVQEQASLVDDFFYQLYTHKAMIQAVNYWVLAGGSTALVTDAQELKPAARVLKQYFVPGTLTLHVSNTLGQPLDKVHVATADGAYSVETDTNGDSTLALPGNKQVTITIDAQGYQKLSWTLSVQSNTSKHLGIELDPTIPSVWYLLQKLFYPFF